MHMTLADLPASQAPTKRFEMVVPDNSKSEHDQTARIPSDMQETGVKYNANERKHGLGRAFHKTGENYNAEDVGRLLREKDPAEKIEITPESGKALAKLVQPHI